MPLDISQLDQNPEHKLGRRKGQRPRRPGALRRSVARIRRVYSSRRVETNLIELVQVGDDIQHTPLELVEWDNLCVAPRPQRNGEAPPAAPQPPDFI